MTGRFILLIVVSMYVIKWLERESSPIHNVLWFDQLVGFLILRIEHPTCVLQEVETNEELRKLATAIALVQEHEMYLKCASKLAS